MTWEWQINGRVPLSLAIELRLHFLAGLAFPIGALLLEALRLGLAQHARICIANDKYIKQDQF